jgi:hypothetical protein
MLAFAVGCSAVELQTEHLSAVTAGGLRAALSAVALCCTLQSSCYHEHVSNTSANTSHITTALRTQKQRTGCAILSTLLGLLLLTADHALSALCTCLFVDCCTLQLWSDEQCIPEQL